ncbi:hypothetical protein BZA77DRAFT_311324 [Pyronema omphalodes]|nr:hypothetical protein BZA77DRAFT_311324 [Pyronema omphalodes]
MATLGPPLSGMTFMNPIIRRGRSRSRGRRSEFRSSSHSDRTVVRIRSPGRCGGYNNDQHCGRDIQSIVLNSSSHDPFRSARSQGYTVEYHRGEERRGRSCGRDYQGRRNSCHDDRYGFDHDDDEWRDRSRRNWDGCRNDGCNGMRSQDWECFRQLREDERRRIETNTRRISGYNVYEGQRRWHANNRCSHEEWDMCEDHNCGRCHDC